MAGETVRSVRVPGCSRLSMDALPEFLHLIGMALGALPRRQLRCCPYFVVIAVAGLASPVAEHAVNAIWKVRSLIGVASRALNTRHFRGVRKVLDVRVAIGAAQNAMHTGSMLGGINRDAFSVARGHSRLTVASQAAFVLLKRLDGLRLGPGVCRSIEGRNAGQEK